MSEFDEMRSVPDDAQCPYCGVQLTPDNVMRVLTGHAGAVVPTDVPGVDEEVDDIPVYRLQCIDCTTSGRDANRE